MLLNTASPDCPVRIMYAACDPSAGPLHVNELDADPRWTRGKHPIAVIRCTEHGDYSGGDVEASNHRVLAERFPCLYSIIGSHGYAALAYDAALGPCPESEELAEAFLGVRDCPIVDDDDHSRLEFELESEAWNDHGAADFRKKLTGELDELDPEYPHEIPDNDVSCADGRNQVGPFHWTKSETWGDFLLALWSHGCDELNVNGGSGCGVKTGCTVHFYVDEWFTKLARDKSSLRADLVAIAHACRVDG